MRQVLWHHDGQARPQDASIGATEEEGCPYQLALARGEESRAFKAPRRDAPPATTEELELLFGDVEAALGVIEFFKTRQAESVMRTVPEIVHCAPLDQREARLCVRWRLR